MKRSIIVFICYLCLHKQAHSTNAPAEAGVKSVLNASEIDIILQQHNEFRRTVVPSATNMRVLSWNDELANRAQVYANECIFRHSRKSSMEQFGYIAESIYIGNEKSDNFSKEDIARPVVAWYNETEFYDYQSNICQDKKVCGHYTQAVWDNTYNVGCGRTRCKNNINVEGNIYVKPLLYVCKYGPAGNIVKIFSKTPRRPYKHGDWCSNCPTEAPVCIDRLCDVHHNTSARTLPVDQIATPTNTLKSTIAATTTGTTTASKSTTSTSTIASTFSTTKRAYIFARFVTLKREEVRNERPVPGLNKQTRHESKAVGLRCYVCNNGISQSKCISNNKTMLCDDMEYEVAGLKTNDWSCAKYNDKSNKIKMECVQTERCESMKSDRAANTRCCRTDLCNDSKKPQINFWVFNVMAIIVILTTIN